MSILQQAASENVSPSRASTPLQYAHQVRQFSSPERPGTSRRRTNTYLRRRRWRAKRLAFETLASLPDCLMLSLVPYWDASESGLSVVCRETANRFRDFMTRVRRAGGLAALRVCTRNQRGDWFTHAHALVVGLTEKQLHRFAQRAGLTLAYCEPVQDASRTASYITSGAQSKRWDRVSGRAYLVSSPKRGVRA